MTTARNPARLAHDLVFPVLLFGSIGGMTWAVRGSSGFGASAGCIFAGVALGATWWQSCRAMLVYARSGLFGAVMLGSPDVSYVNGQVVCNKMGKSVSFKEIAAASYRAMKLPPNTEPGLGSTHFWEPPSFAFGSRPQ